MFWRRRRRRDNPTALALFRFYALLHDLWGSLYGGHFSLLVHPVDRARIPEELLQVLQQLSEAPILSQETFLGIHRDYLRVTHLAHTYESLSDRIQQVQLLSQHHAELRYLRRTVIEYWRMRSL